MAGAAYGISIYEILYSVRTLRTKNMSVYGFVTNVTWKLTQWNFFKNINGCRPLIMARLTANLQVLASYYYLFSAIKNYKNVIGLE